MHIESVKIGDEVLIADRVYISDSTHNSKDLEKSITCKLL